jgi:hypothetical protein
MFDLGYDSLLIVDADELWDEFLLGNFIKFGTSSYAKVIRVGMRHFWRSLQWICDDECAPHRMTNKVGEGEAYYPMNAGRVFHMGYAQSSKIIGYKMSIHGHKNEVRSRWYENTFLAWKPGDLDVHPTNERHFWDPKRYVDDNKLKWLVYDHPYRNMELIP